MENWMIERARLKGTPVIADGRAIFIWEGDTPPQLMADFNGWEEGTSANLEWAGDNLWAYAIELPADAYIEYAYLVDGERIIDPMNPRKTPNGMGKANSFFYMPEARPTAHIRLRSGVQQGKVIEKILGPSWLFANRTRRVRFYQPPVKQAVPLMVVWDGDDYFQRVHLPTILDNMIALGLIQPLALAMVDNGGKARGVEYMGSDATIGMLVNVLIPEAQNVLNLLDPRDHPGTYGVCGASAGGINALFTGLRLPHIFGRVLAQSGAFSLGDWDTVVWELVERADPASLKIWLDAGKYEYLVECNRRMAGFLKENGFNFEYSEYNGGHNYPAWRNEIPAGLQFLFGKRGGKNAH